MACKRDALKFLPIIRGNSFVDNGQKPISTVSIKLVYFTICAKSSISGVSLE